MKWPAITFLGLALIGVVAFGFGLAALIGPRQPPLVGYLSVDDPRAQWVAAVYVNDAKVEGPMALHDGEGWVDEFASLLRPPGAESVILRRRIQGTVRVEWKPDAPAWVHEPLEGSEKQDYVDTVSGREGR